MAQEVRWSIAFVGSPPNRLSAGDGNLTENHSVWGQHPELWTVFYYHHTNALTIGTSTYALRDGDIAYIPPGASCSHAKVGDDCWVDFITFDLPARQGFRSAIPHVTRSMQPFLPNLRKASNLIVDSSVHAQAFIWNLLLFVGQSPTLFREAAQLYEAEDFIRQNLGRKFRIEEIAEFCRLSPRSLLAMFRAEHGVTIQEYIISKRVQEATRLLLRTNLTIKEIAQRVGMPDLQYFNKTMRTMTGLAPSKLRQTRDK